MSFNPLRRARSPPTPVSIQPTIEQPSSKRVKTEESTNGGSTSNSVSLITPSRTTGPAWRVALSREQQAAVNLTQTNRNAFFTGSAGSGKTTTIREVVLLLREAGKTVFIVAPTGRAACEISGTTIHNHCLWTPTDAKKGIRALEEKARYGKIQARLESTDVLIIDEISMVSNYMFERMNRVHQAAKGNEEFFGGIQLIVVGDFCQLPPIKAFEFCFSCGRDMKSFRRQRRQFHKCGSCGTEEADEDKWAFRSQSWDDAKFLYVYLTENHRQTEAQFVKVLDKLRLDGRLSLSDERLLVDHESETEGAVQLFPGRKEVDRINDEEFKKLPGQIHRYKCVDYFRSSQDYRGEQDPSLHSTLKKFPSDHPYEVELWLKIGMPVLLQANLDVEGGLVNGSQGTIVRFENHSEARLRTSRSGIDHHPQELAATDDAEEDNRPPSYVRSRYGELAALRNEQMLAFVEQLAEGDKCWPVVQFQNGREVTIFADARIDQLGHEPPYTLEGRTQIPLMPAWAMTFHKAQGLSLDKVRVDLNKKFEPGHAYVALSRAKTLRGLKVESMGKGCGPADVDQTVKRFHESRTWDLGSLRALG